MAPCARRCHPLGDFRHRLGRPADLDPQTGGDTLWATAITPKAVFLGGHQRWLNNPSGGDSAQPGEVPRPGLAALDPVSGRPWRGTRAGTRGVAVFAFAPTATGLGRVRHHLHREP